MAADDVTDFSVYYFNEGLRGVPQLSGTSGALIAVLDACLITGFGTVSVTSLTVADGVATATVSAGNSFNPHHIILIEGASDPALNGRHRVLLDGNSSTSFSFKTTANGTASGTISAKYAPVPGWEKPFSAANKAVYRATTGNRFYYRVDDSLPEKYVAEIRGYETMASVDVGGAPFPLLSLVSTIEKSNAANATGKYWDLVADCRAVMFGAQQYPAIGAVPFATPARYFGEMVPLAQNGDAWCSAVLSSTEKLTGMNLHTGGSIFHSYRGTSTSYSGAVARGVSGVGGAIDAQCMAVFGNKGGVVSGQDAVFGPAPSAVDGQLYFSPVYLAEGSAGPARAVVPGAQYVPHTGVNDILGVRTTITPAAGPLAGRQLLALCCSNNSSGSSSSSSSSSSSGRYLMDITGPWRTA